MSCWRLLWDCFQCPLLRWYLHSGHWFQWHIRLVQEILHQLHSGMINYSTLLLSSGLITLSRVISIFSDYIDAGLCDGNAIRWIILGAGERVGFEVGAEEGALLQYQVHDD